jgi:hypothetical protein
MRIRVTQGENVFWVVGTVTAGVAGCIVLSGIGLGNLVCFGAQAEAEDLPDDRASVLCRAIKRVVSNPCDVDLVP